MCAAHNCDGRSRAEGLECAPKELIPGRNMLSERYVRPLGTRSYTQTRVLTPMRWTRMTLSLLVHGCASLVSCWADTQILYVVRALQHIAFLGCFQVQEDRHAICGLSTSLGGVGLHAGSAPAGAPLQQAESGALIRGPEATSRPS